MKDLRNLKDYSNYQGNLKGNPIYGTVAYMGGIPFNYEKFTYSLMGMVQYTSESVKGKVHYETVRSSSHAYARNIISRHVIGDWVLMLDTDIEFDPDLLARMLKTFEDRQLHVLTGVYLYKKDPHWPVIYTWDKENKQYKTVKDWITDNEALDIFEIAAAGAGVLLVRKWVFGYIEQQLKEEPFAIRKPFDNPKSQQPLGEDLSFFDRCRQLDIQVVCDPTITVKHIFPYALEVGKDYEPHKIREQSTT